MFAVAAFALPTPASAALVAPGGVRIASDDSQRQTSPLLATGKAWTVTAWEHTAGVAPTPTGQWYGTVYRFRVMRAPRTTQGVWVVEGVREGAQGPFAKGFTLLYAQHRDGSLRLKYVGAIDEALYPTAYADVVIGGNFPLQKRIVTPVRDATVRLGA